MFFDDVRPVAMTMVDWKTFIKFGEDHLHMSPTRGLDDAGIDLKDPAAFVSCLEFNNSPLAVLRNNNAAGLLHASFSFIFIADDEFLKLIWKNYTTPNIQIVPTKTPINNIVVATMNMQGWRDFIYKYCSSDETDAYLRRFAEVCYNFFKATWYRELWYGIKKDRYFDNTLCMHQ